MSVVLLLMIACSPGWMGATSYRLLVRYAKKVGVRPRSLVAT
jgi:hypothetical protein